MFIPNAICKIRRRTTYNTPYGEPQFESVTTLRYALVRFDTKIDDTTVRADSSATRGNIKEYKASGRILVDKNEKVGYGDLVIIHGKVFSIKEVEPRINVQGALDHWECDLEKAEDRYGDEV